MFVEVFYEEGCRSVGGGLYYYIVVLHCAKVVFLCTMVVACFYKVCVFVVLCGGTMVCVDVL